MKRIILISLLMISSVAFATPNGATGPTAPPPPQGPKGPNGPAGPHPYPYSK